MRWQRGVLACFRPASAGEGEVVRAPGGPGAAAPRPNWFKLALLKMKLMKEEMGGSQDYAMWVALRLDRYIFWTTTAGFIIAVILIFAIQAQDQPAPPLP